MVLGEAYLSMLPDPAKARVLAEAFRLLEPGGRFGVHELALVSAARPPAEQEAVRRELSAALHVGARPLTVEDWRRLLETAGFVVSHQALVPMELLRPRQVLRDEGARGTLLIVGRVLREPAIRARVCVLRRTFRSLHGRIATVVLVAHKPRSTP